MPHVADKAPLIVTKVLLLCEYAVLNGAERSLLAMLDGVRQQGFDPVAAAPEVGPLAAALRDRRVPLLPWPLEDGHGQRLPQTELRRRLRSMLLDSRAPLVHANSLSMGRLSGPVVAELGLASIGHLRDIVKLSRQAIADLDCHRRLLAVSGATRQWHVARGLAEEKTHVLYNGVDLDRFRPGPPSGYLHRQLGLPDDALLVGAIGQLGMRKGWDVLVDAAQHVVRAVPRAHLVLVGQRCSHKEEALRFEAQLRQAAATGPAAGHCHFLGLRDDVQRLLPELALLAHPARQEPLGRVLLEAAAAGTPVVATRVGGTEEIFPPPCPAARLVPPDDGTAMARAMVELLESPRLRQAMSLAARQRAQQQFDARLAAQALASHYRDVLQTST